MFKSLQAVIGGFPMETHDKECVTCIIPFLYLDLNLCEIPPDLEDILVMELDVSSFQPLRLKHLHCDDLHIILSLSAVQIYEFHILIFIHSPSMRDKYELSIDQLPVGLIAQLVRALHRYRRGHGFGSRSSLNFFRFLLFNRLG